MKINENDIHYIRREGSVITEGDLLNRLGMDESDVSELLTRRILKRGANLASGEYKVNFVGMVVHKGNDGASNTLVSYPKYLPEEWESGGESDPLDYTGLVLRCLEVYSQSGTRNPEDVDDIFLPSVLKEDSANELALARFFIRDYLMEGIFRYEEVTTSINSSTNVDWNRTIQRSEPVMTRSGPIYTELVTRRRRIVEDDLISNYHRLVVSDYIRKYGRVLGYPHLAPEMVGNIPNREGLKRMRDQGRNSLLWHELRRRLKVSYGSRAIRLQKNLLNSIEPEYVDESAQTMIIGTTDFKWLWEDACRTYLDFEGETKKLNKKLFEKPEWTTLQGKPMKGSPGGRHITDILIDLKEGRAIVADAKYYHLDYDEESESIEGGGPGSQDILKQWAYKAMLEKMLEFKSKDIVNMLLFPSPRPSLDGDLVRPFAVIKHQLGDLIVASFVYAEEILVKYSKKQKAERVELSEIWLKSHKAITAVNTGQSEVPSST